MLTFLGTVLLAGILAILGIVLIVCLIVGLWGLLCWIMIKLGWTTEEEIIEINSN